MRIHRAFTLASALVVVVACDASRKVASESSAQTSCVRCHGGELDQSGAPPRDVGGRSLATLPSVGAHRAHVAAGIDCGACHVKPARSDDGHIDGQAAPRAGTWGALTTANGALTPTYDAAGGTFACASTWCHGSFRGGNAANAPRWTAAGQGQGACGTCHGDPAAALPALPRSSHPPLPSGATMASCAECHAETVDAAGAIVAGGRHLSGTFEVKHPAGWSDPASEAFHGVPAARDPLACNACHAVRPPATGSSSVTCADCHGGPAWTTTCNGCHGQAGDPRGAPPADVRGNTAQTNVGVGAHRRHVDASAASGPLDCVFCHRGYADAYDAGHLDGGAVKVTRYTGADAAWVAAGGDPGWSHSARTCATSYCHSAYAPANAPVWTAPRADACGTCHGLPPGAPHPAVSADLHGCYVCHPDSIGADALPKRGPGGKHLDGQITVMAGHVAGWMVPTSPEFHAYSADRGLANCQACHGADLTGGFAGIGCNACHGGPTWKTNCTMCHGDKDDPAATGAPPRTIWGYGADAVRVGGHGAHVDGSAVYGPIDCAVCHVKPADALSPGHVDAVSGTAAPTASVAFTGRAVTGGAGSTWSRATPTCSVYCHGATFSATTRGSNTTPSWTGGAAEATCGTCHQLPPRGTHPANPQCGSCHAGYTATTVNLATHIDGTVATPTLTCASCHGDPARAGTALNPQLSAAPPVGTNGEAVTTSRGVGAHQLHLVGGALSDGVACAQCHAVPTAFGGTSGHPSGSVELSWGALAGASSAWSSTDFTCASTYCHGNFPMGNATYKPTWTDAKADACGTCHGSPAATASALPVAGHPALASGATNTACAACHPQTVDAAGAIVAGGKHVDGQPQTLDAANHPASWILRTQHGAAAARDGNACLSCHAAEPPATVVAKTCAECHGGPGWTTTCNGCHGEASDPRGAPPADLAGNTAVTAVGVGAHRRHVDASTVSGPLDCVFCHVKPADVFDAGHLDGGATRVTSYTGSEPAWTAASRPPGWSAGTASCATSYCHSAYAPANVPIWTAPRADACGTCHGLPPGGSHPAVGGALTGCNPCHPDSMTADGRVKPGPAGAHLDGRISVMSSHGADWMNTASPGFHAYPANRGLGQCQGCHGQDLGGGFVGISCASCHDGTTARAWGCTTCHGGDQNATGAPPKALWGQAGDAVRVGGHTAHVDAAGLAAAIDCGLCHVKPAGIVSPGHVDAIAEGATPLASVAFSGIAAGATTWSRATPTCTVYCHGAGFSATSAGTNTRPSWTGGPGQATCGSCHGTPPQGTHPPSTQCGNCHLGYTLTSVNLAVHVNGTVETPTLDCFSCHGDRTRPPTAENPQLPAAPPAGTHGETSATARAVGAHQLHLVGETVSDGFACTECHVVPTSFGGTSGHPSGAVELRSPVGGTGTWNPADLTCSATYCHGNFTYGNALNAPIWNSPAATACGTCHGRPPSSPHPTNADCGRCHPGYTGVSVNLTSHVNGLTEVELNCTSCHGDGARIGVLGADANVKVAPPVTATGRPAGAHLAHVNARAKTVPVQCEDCHSGKVPTPSTAHPSDVIDVAFGGRATTGGAAPRYDAATGCAATYCHGNYSGVYTYVRWDWGCGPPDDPGCPIYYSSPYAGANATPTWTAGATTCGSCHGNPPGGQWHSPLHGNLPQYAACELCHPDATGTGAGGGASITDPTKHMNGIVEVTPRRSSGCNCH